MHAHETAVGDGKAERKGTIGGALVGKVGMVGQLGLVVGGLGVGVGAGAGIGVGVGVGAVLEHCAEVPGATDSVLPYWA